MLSYISHRIGLGLRGDEVDPRLVRQYAFNRTKSLRIEAWLRFTDAKGGHPEAFTHQLDVALFPYQIWLGVSTGIGVHNGEDTLLVCCWELNEYFWHFLKLKWMSSMISVLQIDFIEASLT